MSTTSTSPMSPDPSSPPSTGGVRRHHTISAHSRAARASAKDVISEETQEQQQQQQAIWNDDEVVDQDWVGGVGAVGEKTSLHRQSSLPTRYHRGFQNQGQRAGNVTPKTVNSLAAIAGNEGDEEPWRFANYNAEDEQHSPTDRHHVQHPQVVDTQTQSTNAPMSPHYGSNPPDVPSPPPAGSGVRRHVSLTYGAAVGGSRKASSGLKRSGTLQAALPNHSQNSTSPDTSEHAEDEYVYEAEDPGYDDDAYIRQQQQQQQQQHQHQQQRQYANPTFGRSSPWSTVDNGVQNTGYASPAAGIDDVQRALSALELASNNSTPMMGYNTYQSQVQTNHPPRFNSYNPQGPHHQQTSSRGSNSNGSKLPVGTDYDGRRTPSQSQRGGNGSYMSQRDDRNWDQNREHQNREHTLQSRTSNPNLHYAYNQGGHMKAGSSSSGSGQGPVPSVPPIPPQYLQQNSTVRPGLGVATSFANNQVASAGQAGAQPFVSTPIDVPSLIATKGYNPVNFDTRPQFARYFVIKSYTEDDVHKSLKYEIWSSTDPGNKRLDKAFKDTAGRGPIYLFFSVNASGHFCGMAEMLTPVDYTRSSTVWASDKWKGVFKVRWIFVRDIPNLNLRHIKLNNTQERKPVTNSRDTQELLPDAGQEMLRIFHTHPARTSLLQDFAFYELQAMQKMQATAGAPTSQPPSVLHSPQLSAAVPTSNTGYNPALQYSMSPMMGMPMGGGLNPQYGGQQPMHNQAMHQSVMRHTSPAPQHQQLQMNSPYMGF